MRPSLLRIRAIPSVLGASLLALVATGCVHHYHSNLSHVHRAGPPPWAPAHGYRHHHDGVVLVFDRELDCYLVPGHTHHYFYRHHYYRHHHGRWERGPRLDGPWVTAEVATLPPALHRRHARGALLHDAAPGFQRSHGRGIAKRRHKNGHPFVKKGHKKRR